MSLEVHKNPERAWQALEAGDAAIVNAVLDRAAKLTETGQHGLVLAALALLPPQSRKLAAVMEALDTEDAEEAVLEAWQAGGFKQAMLAGAAIRYGWRLIESSRNLLLAELDALELDDAEAIAAVQTGLARVAAVAPELALSGAPICSGVIAAALDAMPDADAEGLVQGYARLLCAEGLEALVEPADVHGLMVHDLLASARGDRFLQAVAAQLQLGVAAAASRLLLATMHTAIDPHGTQDYIARRAQGQGELVDGPMMRGIFEFSQLDYQEIGLDRWEVTLVYSDELGSPLKARIDLALTEERVVLTWTEPIATPTDPAWWPDLLHRSFATGLLRYAIDDQGRLVLRAEALREAFELPHFEAIWSDLASAIHDLQDL